MRVLLIEDDPMLGRGLCQALRDAGMSVDWVQDGGEAELALDAGIHAIILLDLNLAGKPGLEVQRDQRLGGVKTPVLILTARNGMQDRVTGLDLGADDYLIKPIAIPELLPRTRALVRRQSGHAVSTIGNGHITLDLATHEASWSHRGLAGARVRVAASTALTARDDPVAQPA